MQDHAFKAATVPYDWTDPLNLDAQLTDEERAIRDTARSYAQEKLLPRVTQAYLTETTDRAIFSEMGALGLLGVTIPEKYGCAGANYVSYGLIAREIELETLPLCAANDIAVLPWSPLGGGVLTGKYSDAGALTAESRLGASEAQAKASLNDRNLAVARAVSDVAAEAGRSSAQVALNWVLHRPGVTAPILGARHVGQLEDNLGAAGWTLEPEQVDALDKASRLPLPYPHSMYRLINRL